MDNMKTKVVYVLSSDEMDIYLEQTLLSVFSLRKYNPDVCVELVVDEKTDKTLQGKRTNILNYISYKNVVAVPDNFNKIQTSRWLKTRLRLIVSGNFLFVDSDTIITDDLSSIDEFNSDIGAVPDAHVPMSLLSYSSSIIKLAKEDEWTYNENLPYFNSGVFFVRDSQVALNLYERWHNKWKDGILQKRHVSDQSYLAASNEEMGYVIKELDGTWNCQIARNGLKYLSNAKIIHYLGFVFHSQCPPWTFYKRSIYEYVKENGYINKNISVLIENAKSSFPTINGIVADDEVIIARSRLFRFLMRHIWIVTSVDKISRFLK